MCTYIRTHWRPTTSQLQQTLVIKLCEGLTTHLQGLVSQGPSWDTRRPATASSTFLSVKHTNTLSQEKYISLSRLAGGRYGNDGRKTRQGLWVQYFEFEDECGHQTHIYITHFCVRKTHNQRLRPGKIKQLCY